MKTRIFSLGLLSCCMFLILVSCGPDPEICFRDADFNSAWKFHLGDVAGASDKGLNDSEWKPVHLPHDWSIIDYELQDSLHRGPFYKELPGGQDVGYLRDGIGWYRKSYLTPKDLGQKHIIIHFDGVQSQSELWVNGQLMGKNAYGYTPFQFDITSALQAEGENNLIAVKTINPGENSRWFAGAGIYREVSISVLNPVAIAPWGVYLTTPSVAQESAEVKLELGTVNQTDVDHNLNSVLTLISPKGERKEFRSSEVVTGPRSTTVLTLSGIVEDPELWSPAEPNLYQVEVLLFADGKVVDREELMFGIRSIDYSVEEGFILNEQGILMKGACMHHDNGLLGASAFPEAEWRRVQIMKNYGYNAIRTSHNPPSEVFLKACDEIGMLVIDESFDQWIQPKRPNDYSKHFKEWHLSDVQAMVYRDRNHPSVVMWSFGNEVKERANPEGIKIAEALVDAIREVDETRPVTQAVCGFWDNPGKEWDYSAGAFSMQDIGGYNYQFLNYETDHDKHPDRIMYGSESVAKHAWENWEMVKRHSYVLGDFVWTGMDYIGESGIGHHRLVKNDSEGPNSLKAWPWYIAWCGDIDILGNKKAQSYYRDILWEESKLELMVVRPVPEGMKSELSYWGWYDELPSWSWEGHENRPIRVKVYSSYPEVKLELNGEIVGSRILDSTDRYVAEFEFPYAAGDLKAIGIQAGEEKESLTLSTTGEVAQLHLDAEAHQITAAKNSLVFINVSSQDAEDCRVFSKVNDLEVTVTGPAILLAAGNASPEHEGSFSDASFSLFRGRGMIIVRSTGEPGDIEVEVSGRDLQPARTSIKAD